ncbi:ABC transporter permease [Atopobacter phocae]|uniref:ABC transporter permease n=1 Tax=Atopobacter phocae TaxID=136492 RepID=UPI000470BE11|nr:ABC transporter permease [Atopobacter phocae]
MDTLNQKERGRQLYAARQKKYVKQMSHYLKYVLNDHSMLMLFFLLGGFVYFAQPFLNEPTFVGRMLLLFFFLGSLFITLAFSFVLLIKPADMFFMRADEKLWANYFERAKRQTLWTRILMWGVYWLVLSGLFKVYTMELIVAVLVSGLLLIGRYMWKNKRFQQQTWPDWVQEENERMQRVLLFFSQFTTVREYQRQMTEPFNGLNSILIPIRKRMASIKGWYVLTHAFRERGYVLFSLGVLFGSIVISATISSIWLNGLIAWTSLVILSLKWRQLKDLELNKSSILSRLDHVESFRLDFKRMIWIVLLSQAIILGIVNRVIHLKHLSIEQLAIYCGGVIIIGILSSRMKIKKHGQ